VLVTGSKWGHKEEKLGLTAVNRKKSRMRNKSKAALLRYTAYEAIKDKILYLDLKPGDRLSEKEIGNSLGIGRTPVREALLLLEKERLIEIKAGSGFSVCRFTREEVEDYRLIRTAIENFSLALAIQRIRKTEVEALRENLRNLERNIDSNNLRKVVKLESEFHEIIYGSTRSHIIRDTISGLNTKFLWLRSVALSLKGASEECLIQHKDIFKAIEKKDIAEAQRLMEHHLKSGWNRLRDIMWIFGDTSCGETHPFSKMRRPEWDLNRKVFVTQVS
jgi:DNA-binding GntR family transcriptional regulator